MIALRLTSTLISAGLPVTGVSIGSDTDKSTWRVTMTSASPTQVAAAQSIVDGFDPTATDPPTVTPLEFAQLFTQAERIAIRGRRAQADEVAQVIDDFYDLLQFAGAVHLGHAVTVAGIQYMVAQQLITSQRATAILAGVPAA